MAYAFTPDYATQESAGGRRHIVVNLAETEAAAGSEWSINLGGLVWRLMSYRVTLTAGSGSTVNPAIGTAASFTVSTQNHIATNSTTAAHINDQTALVIHISSGVLYGRSTVSSGTDNSISTELVFIEGVTG